MKRRWHRAGLCVIAATLTGSSALAALIGNNANPANIYDINTATGAASNAKSTGLTSSLSGIAFDPISGNLYGLTALDGATPNSLVKINPATGAATVVGTTGLTRLFEGDLAFSPLNGNLYAVYRSDDPLNFLVYFLKINPATGAGTVVGPMNSATDPKDFSALAFNSAGILYTVETSAVSANSVLSIIDPSTGMLSSSVTMNVNLGTTAALAFDPATGTAYLADGGSAGTNMLYTLNITNGVATAIGPLGVTQGLAGLTFIEIPEPSTVGLSLSGGLLLFVRRLKRFVLTKSEMD